MADFWSRKIVSERPISFTELDRRHEKAYPAKAPAKPKPDGRGSQGYIATDPPTGKSQ